MCYFVPIFKFLNIGIVCYYDLIIIAFYDDYNYLNLKLYCNSS